MSNLIDKQAQLDELQAQILKDKVCPELAATATQLVMGDGHPDADIVFIGEAPGKNEDLQGKPFVGAAGKFLDEMLASIELDRGDVYITNIVKYRPPNNRDPLPEEKSAFLPYLQAQLGIIQPKIVVTLGRHSTNCFLPDLQISKIHGQPKRINWILKRSSGHQDADGIQGKMRSQPVENQGASAMQGGSEQRTEPYKEYGEGAAELPTQQRAASGSRVISSADEQAAMTLVILPLYHPAAALYNGAMRQTLLDDFAAIPAILKKI